MAVSKPRPKSTPMGYIFQGASIRRPKPPRNRFMKPRLFNCRSSSSSS